MPFHVLGIDPGYAELGYALVRVDRDSTHVTTMGCVSTRKTETGNETFNGMQARVDKIMAVLAPYFNRVDCIAMETPPAHMPSSRTMRQLSFVCGAIIAEARHAVLTITVVAPKDLKVALTGDSTADKDEIKATLLMQFDQDHMEVLTRGIAPKLLQHPYDALGAVMACLKKPRWLRDTRRQLNGKV